MSVNSQINIKNDPSKFIKVDFLVIIKNAIIGIVNKIYI